MSVYVCEHVLDPKCVRARALVHVLVCARACMCARGQPVGILVEREKIKKLMHKATTENDNTTIINILNVFSVHVRADFPLCIRIQQYCKEHYAASTHMFH